MITAVDPGGTTGIARWDGTFSSAQEADPMEAVSQAILYKPEVIVVENFIPRGGAYTWQPDALHIIGALRYHCWYEGVTFVLQTAAQAKKLATDARLKTMGFWTPGQGHANDAARHLMIYLLKTHVIDPKELL